MKSLTVCMITSRKESEFDWLKDSLDRQIPDAGTTRDIKLMCIDSTLAVDDLGMIGDIGGLPFMFRQAKPTVWQGHYRKTPVDWWAKSYEKLREFCADEGGTVPKLGVSAPKPSRKGI